MKIILLGASGATGRQVIDQALEAGHQVTAYVRQAAKLDARHPHLSVIEGSLVDSTTLGDSIRGHDAVLSTLGHTKLSDPTPLLAPAMHLVMQCMQTHGVRRLVYESAYGTHETADDLPFFFAKVFKPWLLKYTYADHEAAEALIRQSSLDWTIVRPVGLSNGPRTGVYKVAERLGKGSGFRISRADVADLMVKELSERQWLHKAVGQAK